MDMEGYKVDYHLIQAIYFDPNDMLLGSELAQIWSSTRVFGKHRVTGAFWHAGQRPPAKLPRFEIGSLEHLEPLLVKGPQPIFGGGTLAQKKVARDSTLDADFYFACSEASRWQIGETMPSLLLSISNHWLKDTGVEAALQVLKESLVRADRRSAPYGLVDVATPEDAYAGMTYVSTWMQRLPLHRWVEQGNWVYSASKTRDRARGIYWGNFFGKQILERIGGRDRFLKGYREQARMADGTPNAIIWELTNGVFVSLCLSPMGCVPGMPLDYSAMFNLRWLHQELLAHGVLWGAPIKNPYSRSVDSESATMERTSPPFPFDDTSQTVSDLNEQEARWIDECLEQAEGMVKKYAASRDEYLLSLSNLDRAFEEWIAHWKKGGHSEGPNTVANCIGVAFGQWLVAQLGMKWMRITDSSGTDICVRIKTSGNPVTVFPTHAVAKRLEPGKAGCLQELFSEIRFQVEGLCRIA